MSLDLEVLGSRLLRPDRPRLGEAAQAIAGIADAPAAWERLIAAGLVEPGWARDPRRALSSPRVSWLCAACDRASPARGTEEPRCAACGDSDSVEELSEPAPLTLGACLALAADPGGLRDAEALAEELAEALGAVDGIRSSGISWHVVPRALAPAAVSGVSHELMWRGVGAVLDAALGRERTEAAWQALVAELPDCPNILEGEALGVVAAMHGWRLWDEAASLGFTVPAVVTVRRGDGVERCSPPAAGMRFADLANPYPIALALWQTGYAIARTERSLVLVAPEA